MKYIKRENITVHHYQFQPVQTLGPAWFCFDSPRRVADKDIHSVGICTGPSCKNELEWSPDNNNIPSHLHHGYLGICDPPRENRDKGDSTLTARFHFKTKENGFSTLKACSRTHFIRKLLCFV